MFARLFSLLMKKDLADPSYGPSDEAIDAASEYYSGLYQSRLPDPVEFSRICSKYGVPDWPNPYPESEVQHYEFHPDGFLFADLEAILVDMMKEREGRLENMDQQTWPDLASAVTRAHLQNEDFQHRCAMAARHCWAIMLASGQAAPRIAAHVHPDNIWLVNMDILNQAMNGDWPDVDPARVAEGMRQFSH